MELNYWQRRQRQISRRRFVGSAAAAAAGLAAFTAVGCGDDDSGGTTSTTVPGQPPASSPTEQPRAGGTFRTANTSPVGIQDPHFGSTNQWVTPFMGDSLLEMSNSTRKLSGSLVERWEQPDPQTLVLTLRKGVKFFNLPPVNGREMEGKDVVYAIKSMYGSQYPDAKTPFPRKSLFDGLKEPVVTDKYTVRLEFTKPRWDAVVGLAEKRMAVIPEGLRETFGGLDSLQGPKPERLIGTGPFICEKFDPEGEMLWKRNPDYWNKPYPYLDAVQQIVVKDTNTWATAMISGQNNILTSIQEQTVDLVKRGLPNVQVLNYAPDGYWYHLGLNTRKKPLNDPRFRKALALVIDKQGFAKNIFGKDQARVPGPLPWIYDEAISQDDLAKTPGMRTPTDQDYADAKSLLSAAAVDKVTLTITAAVEQLGTHQYKALAEYVKSQVEKYLPGVTINIDATNYTAMLAKIGQPDTNFDIYTGGWVHELSPIAMMSVSYYSKGGRNFGGYNDSKLDGYLDSANAELDAAKRADLIRNAQKLALEQWSHIPTHHGQFTALLSPNVRNLELGSVAGASYYLKYAWLKG